MDSRAVLLSGCDEGPCFPINNVWVATVFLVLIAPTTIFLAPYVAFRMLQEAGRVKLSMEPVVCTGLGLAAASPAAPPSFNVTLRAKSTYGLLRLCTSGPAAMEVAYSGTTIAMADVGPFCIEPRGEKVITATASPGWPALPAALQERMESDRRHGGVRLEAGFGFQDEQAVRWARCRTTLGDDKASPCNVYFIKGC